MNQTHQHWIVLLAMLLMATALIGCVTPEPTLYRWGNYEQIVYRTYKDPSGSDPVNDAIALAEDMARTEAEGKIVPPGARVHLGYLYFLQGKEKEARALFELERDLFPASSVFIDGLLSRIDT